MESKKVIAVLNERRNKSIYTTFRILQAIFLGIFALGLSNGIGEYLGFLQIPIGTFSVTTTLFGMIGSIMTGVLAKQSETW
jgi:hypothetical protein